MSGLPVAKRTRYNLRSCSTKLLALNDDCFNEIFGHLDAIDLCSVTRVCTRFEQLAVLHSKRKFSEFDFSTLYADRLISNQVARDVLRNFGQMMKSVTLPRLAFYNHDIVGYVEEGLLKDMIECCGKNVGRLRLKNFHFTTNVVDALNLFSQSLKSFSLLQCTLEEDCHLYNFSSLKSLTIADTRYAFTDIFPTLRSLQLFEVSIPNNNILQVFLVTHKQLELLVIRRCKGISSEAVSTIGKHLINLRGLYFIGDLINESESIEQIQNNILHLGDLKNLQSFEWHCKVLSIGNLLAKIVSNKTPIQVLYFSSSVVDYETIKAIKKMKNLEYLCFYRTNGMTNEDLVEIAQEMTQLKKLYIWWQQNITFDVLKKILPHTKQLMELRIRSKKFRLDPTLYNDILDIVKERRNGIKLTIKIDSGVQNLIPQQTIQMNKNWLVIEHVPCRTHIFEN